MVTITKDTIIGDILDMAPQTAPIFLSIGMHCLGCPSSRGETVAEACAVHGVDVEKLLEAVRQGLYQKALENREKRTFTAAAMDEMVQLANEKSGFIKAMWCGDEACELKLKESAGVSSRCIPFEQEQISNVCVCCGKPAKKMVYWGKAY